LRAWDLKALVAYSSIVHMGAVTLRALTCTELGFWVAQGIMVAHSIVSPVLFILASIVYADRHSRAVITAGLRRPETLAKAGVGLFAGFNFGLPPFLSFWVELALFGLYGSTFALGLVALALASFLTFVFSISFYIARQGLAAGPSKSTTKPLYELVLAAGLLGGLPLCGAALI